MLITGTLVRLRLWTAGWSRLRTEFGQDQAVRHDRSRRDWIELHLSSLGDLDRLGPLLRTAMAANA